MKLFKKLLVIFLIVVAGLAIKNGSLRQEEIRISEEKPIKFAIMSDIHSDWKNFKEALEKAKEGFGGNGGFVIVTGDLTTLGLKSELIEAKKILDESGLKYFVVPGNHDVWWGRKYKKDVWKEIFGKSFQSFLDDGVKFILINNGDGEGGLEGFGGVGQKKWLEEEAEECLRIYCLVFMHMPLNHPNSLHIMGEDNTKIASEAGQIKELFVKDQIREIFAGHLHFSSSYELEGLKTTVVGAVTSDRNTQSPKFMTVEVKDGELVQNDVFLSD